jgi:hypothetical protein
VDDSDFRRHISQDTKEGLAKYGAIKQAIEDFSGIGVNIKLRETLETKTEAYTAKLEELFRKFQDTVRQIQEKEKQFIEMETKRKAS